MSGLTQFESRRGRVKADQGEIFRFFTDLRNFEQFVPSGIIGNWTADSDSCSFSAPVAGTVRIRISEKYPSERVVYKGDGLRKDDFILTLFINATGEKESETLLKVEADLNPFLKPMASGPVNDFLEMVTGRMEAFDGWTNVR